MSLVNSIRLLTYRCDLGSSIRGARLAPDVLISHGLPDRLRALGHDLSEVSLAEPTAKSEDPGSGPPDKLKKGPEISTITSNLAHEVRSAIQAGEFPLTLGGDHSLALGSIAGAAKAAQDAQMPDLAVLYVDAHADINTPHTSPSGNIHGMPLAFATGMCAAPTFSWLQQYARLDPKRLVYIGLRDLDQAEKDTLRDHHILAFDMHDVDHLGIRTVMDRTLDHFGDDRPVYLSFDVDSLDPLHAPSVTLPVDGGLTLREGRYIARRMYERGKLLGMEVVEINPEICPDGVTNTANATLQVICSALGERGR